ncbi:hypothetical protein LSI01_14410 [Furfurilactobacillus siliginis]|uniref:Uncharacterized protein n=1 Tax=Furfurilactobacillus siliginis TaxID=348151 RepID=A0A510VWG1_9LACO|nr:hypothetical protein LSI01_14410 [Furfurilactobacillus siliginis]
MRWVGQDSKNTWQVPTYDYDSGHGEIIGHVTSKMLRILLDRLTQIYREA